MKGLFCYNSCVKFYDNLSSTISDFLVFLLLFNHIKSLKMKKLEIIFLKAE